MQYSYLHLALPFIKNFMHFLNIARIIINNNLYKITDISKVVKSYVFLSFILPFQLRKFIKKMFFIKAKYFQT